MPAASRIGNAAHSGRAKRTNHAGVPAKNVAADPVRNYEIAPKEIVRLMGELRKRRLKILGIYHSHPYWLDTNEPSPKDIALACYSEAIHFIVEPNILGVIHEGAPCR